jgi:hypothetical protein
LVHEFLHGTGAIYGFGSFGYAAVNIGLCDNRLPFFVNRLHLVAKRTGLQP